MRIDKLGSVESRFADLIWEHEPISSGDLVKRAQAELNWKKPTTYTVLRKLCQRGLFKNEQGIVQSVISRDEYYARQSKQFVEETFDGSLPAFVTAFTSRKKLSPEEIDELQRLIDESRES